MLLFNVCIFAWVYTLVASECSKYLIPSAMPGAGRGIVAGVSFEVGVEIESNPTLAIPKELTRQTQLTHYVYGTGDFRYDMLMIGAGSIYNHFDPRTVYYTWRNEVISDPALSLLPFTDFTPIAFHSVREITQGEEMLNFYGETWFDRFDMLHTLETNRQSAMLPTHRYTYEDLKEFGHCLSDTYVSESHMRKVRKGLIAGRNFAVGQIVAISPVLVLSKRLIETHDEESVFKNYCITVSESNVALMPLSTAAMINHKAPSMANVKLEWYDWSPAVEALSAKYPAIARAQANNTLLRLSEKLQMSSEALSSAPFAPFDVAYRATRSIAAGEEILLDYGPAWEAKWKQYITRMEAWKVKSKSNTQDQEFPLFRQYIQAPDGMFSPLWVDADFPQCRFDEG